VLLCNEQPKRLLDCPAELFANDCPTLEAMAPAERTTMDDLLRKADAALYRSKSAGRGLFSFYSNRAGEAADDRASNTSRSFAAS
jgi:hypothetical protein